MLQGVVRIGGLCVIASLCVMEVSALLRAQSRCLLKTDSGYPKDAGVTTNLHTLGIPCVLTPIGQLIRFRPHPFQGKGEEGPTQRHIVVVDVSEERAWHSTGRIDKAETGEREGKRQVQVE